MLVISYYVVMTLFLILSISLILLVLIQKGRGGGISGAFGGGGGNTAFGAKTGDVLTWATSVVFGLFMLLAVALNLIADRLSVPTPAQQSTPAMPASPSGPTGPDNSQLPSH